jgi:hypothetical protein
VLECDLDRVKRRLRCHGHIFNLVAKAFLWGNHPVTFEDVVDSLVNKDDEEAELLLWRKKVPVGKLHNIIIWIG